VLHFLVNLNAHVVLLPSLASIGVLVIRSGYNLRCLGCTRISVSIESLDPEGLRQETHKLLLPYWLLIRLSVI